MDSKVVVITGASGGIGAAIAKKLGSEKYNLVLAARRLKELQNVAEQSGTKALSVVTDVTVRKDMERLRDVALKEFGKIDVWINNAGRGVGKKVLELTDLDFDEIINSNLKSVFYGIQTVIPYFQKTGSGHLINISSFLGRVPLVSFRSIYSAAKSAVNSLTANLRMDMKKEYPGIKVSLVMPGTVLTDFPKNALGGTPQTSFSGSSPMKPQTAEEVAGLIAELIRNPKPELYTNPANPGMLNRYYSDVGAFEDDMFKPK